mmetsp:Transcript_32198/g.94708  ORF Transcript_32198/g.94708 Transcript_32198/m.94708 type:complete len:111 (-) Transcript_32198:225-557(-)|eukprot:4607876-Prymnesium_polylepis.2
MSALRDFASGIGAPEIALACGSLICLWVIYHTAFTVIVHIVSGLILMSAAAFALIKGQLAKRWQHRAGWYAAVGGVVLLFFYWALTVVFRPPKIKEGVGCGGVKFIHDEL